MRMCLSKSRWFRNLIFFSLALPLSSGCGGIKKNRESAFLKPLAASSQSEAKNRREAIPSERSLCLETAKTVASQGHATEAMKLYERAEQLDPAAAPFDAELAPLYADVGNQDAAIQRYQRCVTRTPDDIELSNNFAWTLMEAGRFEEAITEAERGLQKAPDNVRLRSTLAMIHYRQGDRAAAMQQFQQAHGRSAAHHNLAILDIDAGNLDAAETHVQIAKQSAEPNSKTQLLVSALESQGSSR
ncbi:tetratricopeptide repeat protein [Novipirellula artificiosorum]|uniref:Cellulose synthase subunit BcsC n=1 Tax=Novipirellula artificiosorum TaxID=2528016 RepID=A0A5C6D605_9BACT|nr:tetratricopeptide repeat protein [Novipirellula artificiosorum]TWU31137.1 cellulose synthase subunit BcsC [Novipirellula artificiosorum]